MKVVRWTKFDDGHILLHILSTYFPIVSICGNPDLCRRVAAYLKPSVFATAHTQMDMRMKWEEPISIPSYVVCPARAGSEMNVSS